MITLTFPAWMTYWILVFVVLGIVNEGLKFYLWFLNRKIAKLTSTTEDTK